MTVCNQNKVHCGFLKSLYERIEKERGNKTLDEMPEMEQIKIVYKLNGCNASATDLQTTGNQEDKGKL